jgi:two-component system cell cycle sensor histidine kinase/response regulator CckA
MRAMSLSLDELAIVADELPVAIWLGRVPGGEVVYTNRAFREVLGMEPPPGAAREKYVEPYGVHLPDGSPYPEKLMPFERALAAQTTVIVDDLVIHRRDGRKVNLRVFAKPITDDAGTITHVLEAFIDITREIEAEASKVDSERKLARAQRLESIGQLVMGIAHDFNNLLTVTTLIVGQLLARSHDDLELRAGLTDIETVTASAAALVKKLQSFTQPSPQALAPVELGPLVRSVLAISQRTFDRRITLTSTVRDEVWVLADAAQLEQVLVNLLFNARDAVQDAGTIHVGVDVRTLREGELEGCTAGDYVVLEVSDDGVGIDPAIGDRIFEPYFTTKMRGQIKGTGLGLSTVLGIVRAHGGFIEATNVKPRGTCMRIVLPMLAHEQITARATPRPPREPVRGEGQLVLVVDDEPRVRSATSETLTSLGYRVVEAESGDQALDVMNRHASAIAAVVLDMVMPGMPTTDVCAALIRNQPELPIIVVTGSADTEEVAAVIARGARTCLAKPFDAVALARVLGSVLA